MRKLILEYKKLKILILSTDTLHHRFFINSLEKSKIKIEKYLLETTFVKSKFKTSHSFEKQQKIHENKFFFKNINKVLDKKKILLTTNINHKKIEKYLKVNKPDIGIVFGTRKIEKNIISKFKYGMLNVHRGNIKAYRGLDSELWAIYHKDYKNIMTTIHKVNTKFDNGRIIFQKKTKLKKGMKLFELRSYMTVDAFKMIVNIVKNQLFILKDKSELKGRYYSFMPTNIKNIVNQKFNDHQKK